MRTIRRQIGYLRAGRRPIANLHALRSRLRSSAIRVDVERAEPEFAQRVRGLFDGHRHKTIATVRTDRSPRISGIEVTFKDGELAFGSMPDARTGADLGRDPRFALHSATIDPVEDAEAQWPGDATISRRAIHAGPLPGGSGGDRFYADIAEVVHTPLNEKATMLVVD